jgi:PAS domain S-box-containing protein
MAGRGPGGGAQDVLEQQLAVQARIARLAHTLLSLPAEDLDQGIREQLAVAAEIAGVERTRLIVLNPLSGRVAAAYEWWAGAGCVGESRVEADVLVRYAWARERITRGEVVQIPSVEALPSEAGDERHHIDSRGMRSVLVIPVRSGDAVVGGHVYASMGRECSWSEQEIANLRVVTEIFTSAMHRRHTELALRESEQRFRAIAEHATELVAEFDQKGRFHYASPSFTSRLGHDPAELIGHSGSRLVHPDDLAASNRMLRSAFESGAESRVVHRVLHRDGSWRWFESTGRAYRTANGSPRFVSIGRDITERKAMEQALLRFFDLEQRVAALSRRFLAVSAQELDGAIREALAEAGALGAADRVILYSAALTPDGRMPFYHEWCAPGIGSRSGGRRPWAEARLARGEVLHLKSIDDIPAEAIREREIWQRCGIRSSLVIPVRLEGELVGLIGFERQRSAERWSDQEIGLLGLVGEILTSASRRCLVEEALRESEARLLHAQKLEAVGRLAGGIAHDFNNLLSVILGFSRPLLRELPESDPVREDVREIDAAAERGAALTRQLLTFGRRQETPRRSVDLNTVLRGIQPLLRRLLGDDVEIVLDLDADLARVTGDPQHFEQVVINLAVNARDAMPDGGCLRLETRNQALAGEAAKRHRLPPGPYVRFSVGDSGVGMDEETRARIFEPFFTTKEPGKGTGLGLSIVYSLVEQAGGSIAVEAAPGKGTSFEILLPAATQRGAGTGRSSSGPSGRLPSTSRKP